MSFWYLDEYPTTLEGGSEKIQEFKENPFYSFKLLVRIGNSLAAANVTCRSEDGWFPQWTDSFHINVCRRRYAEIADDFAAGKLAEYNFNLPLSLDETLILADAARLVERFDVNIEFLSLAVKKTGSSDLKAEIERTLADSIDDHNKLWMELANEEDIDRIGLFAEIVTHVEPLELPPAIIHRVRQSAADGFLDKYPELNMYNLCTAELSKLKCWYETSQTHPYFIISPLKIEQISTNRRANARIIHGAIGEKRIATLLDVTKGEMKQANIKDFDTNVDSVSPKRTSIQIKLPDEYSDFLRPLYEEVGALLDHNFLTKWMSGDLYISEYCYLGAHFDLHYDIDVGDSTKDTPSSYERLATLMIYLTDVPLGGKTVFPDLGVAVQPSRGAALIWNNLSKQDGSPVMESIHELSD
ncbi:prolyl 4-hydroxylase subunit alpha-2 [Folsomia candida]|uniref:prolyl 4-hydroxylase subunit alpha-2 n=1 Tax=Folsomia candida TaxID=158441 RepID=UPI000B9015C1|nr:prolyl 4-hydroxylase subunit alpha-2 [Folsomia candida]